MAATTKDVPRPYGRGTSFVVSFVFALNNVNVVAVATTLVLHVGVIGHVPRQSLLMFSRRSCQGAFALRTLAGQGGLGAARP